MLLRFRGGAISCALAALGVVALASTAFPADEPLVITATRLAIPESESPAAITVIEVSDLAERQINRVADALREVPGLDVVQTGAPGQLTSVFTRGLKSEQTQVLIDGVPLNQGLAGLFNFADLNTTGLDRIEVQRGPQSTLYGPRALGGTIQLFTRRGEGPFAAAVSFEGGSFESFRERASGSGSVGGFDYLVAASRLDTSNARPNNEYRSSNAIVSLGWSPSSSKTLRFGLLVTASNNDTGNPGPVTFPKPRDNLLTKQFLIAPNVAYAPFECWKHRLVVSYDRETQTNDPNDDGFVGPTKAFFHRTQIDYQNDLELAKWLTLTSGLFYARNAASQDRPFFPPSFGPVKISDRTNEIAGFVQASLRPVTNLLVVIGGRVDSFSDFGTIGTGRLAASYQFKSTGTTLRSSYATGFSPPTIQDKIFRQNVETILDPERSRGFDVGFEQVLWGKRLKFGVNYFYNRLSNVIGFDNNFNTFNLGRARTQGVEAFARWEPVDKLVLNATYTYLDARRTSSADITQPDGARLPRRARNQFAATLSYQCLRDRLTAGLEGRAVNGREEINFGGPNSDIPDYAVGRLWANYQISAHVKITARVENLTNRSYEEVPGFPALSRGFYGGFEWKF